MRQPFTHDPAAPAEDLGHISVGVAAARLGYPQHRTCKKIAFTHGGDAFCLFEGAVSSRKGAVAFGSVARR